MSKFLDKTILVGFFALLAFTALAHGAVEFWSVALSSALIVLLVFLWVLKGAWEKTWTIYLPTPIWPLTALIIWGLIQSIAWKQKSFSRDIEATHRAVLWLILLWLTFVLAANVFTQQERLKTLGRFLTVFGFFLAFFALLQQATWNGRFYWLRAASRAEVTMPFGPFVHHGHYAGYMELLLPLPLAFLVLQSQHLAEKLLYGFAAALMGVSVIVSLARGGMISLGVQLLFLVILSSWMARKRRTDLVEVKTGFRSVRLRIGAVVTISVAMLLGVFWIGIDPVLDRIAQGQMNTPAAQVQSFFNNRGWIWRDAWAMFRAHPVTGVGLGAFETAFPIYSQSDGSLTVSAAHNDYLQILSESGLVGGVLAIWFMVVLLYLLAKAMRSRDHSVQAWALGGGTGMVGMMVHSFFDFNLQLPSHALLFLTLVAVVTRLSPRTVAPQATAPEPAQHQPINHK
jgi:O-antigen ligase